MSEPCTKEAVLTTLQVKQAEIAGDVSHIRARIENGMSKTIKQIDDNLTALKPVIEHHADIVKRIEDFGWLVSKTVSASLIATVIGLAVWAIGKGFVPKL